MKNYTIEKEQYLDDFKLNAKLLRHNKSGARVVLFPCDDSNKVFSIAFKTAPIDNAGISHILEHSVLCGSKKFPLKEPFVELIKGSLNTFLNAFTFSDKTMYPIASKNDKDFANLMSVYMDAVLNPQIYDHEEIFLQEGWRYEINSKDEPLTYNGVVYNEMKGAFSSADECLSMAISKSLYPDNCYGLVSGGDPKFIPSLSYQKFIDFHKKLYHPSNSYIFLYGDMDMEDRLEWLDNEYLSKYEKTEIISKIEYQKPFKAPVEMEALYPIGEEDDPSDKYYFSYNVCTKDTLDAKTTTALDTLVTVLFNLPGAPVKEALIKQNLGTDVYASFRSDYFQPMINIVVKGAHKDAKDKFIQTIEDTLKSIVEKGIDKDTIISTLNFIEFKTREAKYDMPKGLIYNINLFTSWLYDDTKPFVYADTLKFFEEFRKEVSNGYFENLITECILNNNHKSFVSLIPSKTYQADSEEALVKKLADYKATLSDEEIESLIEKNKKLKEYQATPDSPETLATLPKLQLSDVDRKPERLNIKKENIGSTPLYVSNYNTNGIMYVKYVFDITKMSNSEAQYISLLTELFGYMSTSKHTYGELTNISNSLTGGMAFNMQSLTTVKGEFKSYLTVKFSCLDKNLDKVNSIVKEIMFETKLSDKVRLKEILNELKGNLEQSIPSAGHAYAARRAQALDGVSGYFTELTRGISYYDFISEIVKNFDSKANDVVSNLETISSKIFAQDNLCIHIVGDDTLANALKDKNIISDLQAKCGMTSEFKFVKLDDNVAYTAPIDVNYVAIAGSIGKENYNGSVNVIRNAISNSYLWQVVRVKGGAYGCFMNVNDQGKFVFSSYRDGNIASTVNAYKETPDFLASFEPDDQEFEKIKIGAIGSIDDAPHVETLGSRAFLMALRGVTYENVKKEREMLLDATLEDFKAFGKELKDAFSNSHFAVIGSEVTINKNKDLFDKVIKLTN